MAKLECILHIPESGTSDEDIQSFISDPSRWSRVKAAASSHLLRKTSKYSIVCRNLPDVPCESSGYHYACFRKFTSVPAEQSVTQPTAESGTFRRSQCSFNLETSSSGVLQEICIFCKKNTLKVKQQKVPLTSCEFNSAEKAIKNAAQTLNDKEMLVKIGNIGFHSSEVKYHEKCRRDYLNAARAASRPPSTKTVHCETLEKALDSLFQYVEASVIDNNRPEYLVSLHRRYRNSLKDLPEGVGICLVRTLGDKISEHFGQRVHIELSSRKKGLVVFSSETPKQVAFTMACNCDSMEEFTVIDAARILRSAIMEEVERTPELPTSPTLEDCKKGQAETPEVLKSFFTALLSGSHESNALPADLERKVQSFSQDAVYCVSRARIKPAKHLCMGLGMKSLTGSRRVVEILNRMGHSISYHTAESIETEVASSILEKNRFLPDILLQQPGLSTGSAWDNYDELTETLSGGNTLHDTVGICYQNQPAGGATQEQVPPVVEKSQPATVDKPNKRRRHLDAPERTILPYKRRPSMSTFSFDVYTAEQPANLDRVVMINRIWMICCFLYQSTPMWRGWNSLVCNDPLPKQVIGYMENIELPPTRLDVVRETMTRSQRVATECGEKYTVVTYDLAIAKPALQIQAQESPQFDNVFVCFGTFHIYMAYFACLGYILESSGGPEILCGADVIASGSMRGFLAGKHFNRCKRIHPLYATALQILHFQQFLESEGGIPDDCKALLNTFSQSPSSESVSSLMESASVLRLLEKYAHFCDNTRAGLFGPTAQYWLMYIDLIHIYLLLDRACRTNDVALFIYALGEMIPVFFACHRPNYARWITRYHLNLLNMELTHPGIRQVFDAGALSIRRTSKSFSRSAVDLTLEQTINRDAASRQGGIAAFTQNTNARKRWTVTRSFRGAIVSCLLEMAGLTAPEEVSSELKPSRIRKDHENLKDIMSEVEGTRNPFVASDDNLYCLSTGKAASDSVKNDLLVLQEKGSEWHQQFVTECKEDPTRFERPIKRKTVKNFGQDAVKMKVPAKDKKLKEVKCTRDLFGRLLYLALTQEFDLGTVLSYPLLPVPLSLCQITGNMNKTSKSKLMEVLEAMGTCNTEPTTVDAYLIDAMFFIRTLPSLPPSFGGVARLILQQACANAREVHLVCDTYPGGPSIKDQEHDSRGDSMCSYKITGPLQRRPSDFGSALRSKEFKLELLSFLKDEWTNPAYASILEGHHFYFATGGDCFLYTVAAGIVQRQEIPELESCHEEADTRLIFHANFVAEVHEGPAPKVVVRSIDTDVFILLVHHSKYIDAELWLDAGVNAKNTRRLIHISELAVKVTPEITDALPALHALSGCDYTASFMRKGKQRPYEVMVKNERFTKAMCALGSSDKVDMDVAAALEEFVCCLYGLKNVSQVNDCRLHLFKKLYAPKTQEDPLGKIKSSDPCCLPPCRAVLDEKLKRTNYVAFIWKNARKAQPGEFGPVGHGWRVNADSRLEMVWFEGPQMPESLSLEDLESDETDTPGEDESDGEDDMLEQNLSSDEEESDDDYE